jgi:ribosomal protein L17
MSKLIVDCSTGETIERELTKAEKDQQKIDEAIELARQAELEAKEAARQAILDRLGLTADEAKLLLG